MPLFKIAGLSFYIEHEELDSPFFYNYRPFRIEEQEDASLLFRMRYGRLPEMTGEPSVCFRSDRGLYRIWLGGSFYRVEFQPLYESRKYRMQADGRWSDIVVDIDFTESSGWGAMNELVMVAYVYSAAFHDAVLMHASCIGYDGRGVAFVGPSGIGKSTHSQLWVRFIQGSSLLNDDQPIVRLIDGVPYLSGSPWSGKTACYRNETVRLETLFCMEQAKENRVEPLTPRMMFGQLLSSCAMIKEDAATFAAITQTLASIAAGVKAFRLWSRPEKEAAELAFSYGITLKKQV